MKFGRPSDRQPKGNPIGGGLLGGVISVAMTDKQREDRLAYALFFSVICHYFLGYGFWNKFTNINIFYVTLYFCMDMWGFATYLLSRDSKLLKGAGALGMVLGSYYFYMEFNTPESWEARDVLTLVMILCNVGFLMLFTDKIKKK
jgi:hypothetical protein